MQFGPLSAEEVAKKCSTTKEIYNKYNAILITTVAGTI